MGRRSCTFTETDLKRAIRSVVAAGLTVERIEIEPDGRILIRPGPPVAGKPEQEIDESTEWSL